MRLNKNKLFIIFITILMIATVFLLLLFHVSSKSKEQEQDFKFYKKLSSYIMPAKVMNEILTKDIKSHKEGNNISFVTIASILAAKYYGDWNEYSDKDLQALVDKLKYKQNEEDLKQLYSNYEYFRKFYAAIFSNFVGKYKISKKTEGKEQLVFSETYGLKPYFPIAYGYDVNFNDNFDNEINLAKKNGHFGIDILIKKDNTPIIAVESGVVSKCFDEASSGQFEITSFDGNRTYIYGSGDENKNIIMNRFKKDDVVAGGQIIGFFTKNNLHRKGVGFEKSNCCGLHFGLRLSLDDNLQKKEIYVNVYNILKLLEHHKAEVMTTKTGQLQSKYVLDDSSEIFNNQLKKRYNYKKPS